MKCIFPDCITKLSKYNKNKQFCHVHQRIIDGEGFQVLKNRIIVTCEVCKGKGHKKVSVKILRKLAKEYDGLT